MLPFAVLYSQQCYAKFAEKKERWKNLIIERTKFPIEIEFKLYLQYFSRKVIAFSKQFNFSYPGT